MPVPASSALFPRFVTDRGELRVSGRLTGLIGWIEQVVLLVIELLSSKAWRTVASLSYGVLTFRDHSGTQSSGRQWRTKWQTVFEQSFPSTARVAKEAGMRDPGVDAVIRQWAAELEESTEEQEADHIASVWLAEVPQSAPGIPGQRLNDGAQNWAPVDRNESAFLAPMQERLPDAPLELLQAAAGWWEMIGDISEAEAWWDAGLSPLDQRALDYRAAGLTPADLAKRLGPLTVLEHLRRGSAPEWCVARLSRRRREVTG